MSYKLRNSTEIIQTLNCKIECYEAVHEVTLIKLPSTITDVRHIVSLVLVRNTLMLNFQSFTADLEPVH